jgi:preprotein translocase subunit SecG
MPKCAKCGEVYDADYDGCPNCAGTSGLANFLDSFGKWLVWVFFVLLFACMLASWFGR